MYISECATAGTTSKKTIRLHAFLNGHQVLILVDSGSSSNFISNSMVGKIQLPTILAAVAQVTIANGGCMTSKEMVPAEMALPNVDKLR